MISKELLSEVLTEKLKRHNPSFKEVIESAYDKEFEALQINYLGKNGVIYGYMINIYDLSYKCKEWAFKNGYFLHTTMKINHITKELSYKVSIEPTEYAEYAKTSDTEPEAVFEACEWILKNTR